jgi:hypothetical protein
MAGRDPRLQHPGHDPSIPPRRPGVPGIPGTALPPIQRGSPSPTTSVPPRAERKTAKRAKHAGLAVLVTALLGGIPAIILAARQPVEGDGKAPTEASAVTPATQPAMDAANAEIQRLKKCVSLLAQALCKTNGGALGPDWDCDSDAFTISRDPPPILSGNKVFPCSQP